MLLKIAKFCLLLTPLTVIIVSTGTLFPFIVGKYVFFRTAVDLALIFFLLSLVFDTAIAAPYLARLKRLVKSPLGISVLAFTFVFVLACATSLRPAFSFWSNFERGEGGVQILTLAVYFFLMAALFDRRDWTKLLWMSLVSALLMVLYGVGAGRGWGFWLFVGPKFGADAYRFQGSIGNPAYVAAYLIFQLFFAVYLFITNPPYLKNWRSWLLVALTAAFSWAFLLAATRGAFLGLVTGIVVAAGVLAYSREKWRKPLIIGAVILVALVAGLIFFQHNPLVAKIPGARIFNISFSADTFATRRVMWSIAWHGWQARPLLGWGPENFLMVFDRYFDARYFIPSQGFGAWFDRAHSIIFDYLSETGILGFLSYLSMFGVMAWMILRRRQPRENYSPREEIVLRAGLAGIIVAYLVQGIILFDVLTIYQNLFIVLALTASTWALTDSAADENWKPEVLAYSGIALGVLAGFAGIYFSAFLPYGKAARFIAAERQSGNIQTEEQFESVFRVPLDFRSPVGAEEVTKYLSNDVMDILPQIKDKSTAKRLVAFLEPYLWKDEVRHLLTGGELRYILWHNFKDESDYKEAEDYFLKAHSIGPKLPQPLYSLYQLYKEKGDTAKMKEMSQAILAIWPDAAPTLR